MLIAYSLILLNWVLIKQVFSIKLFLLTQNKPAAHEIKKDDDEVNQTSLFLNHDSKSKGLFGGPSNAILGFGL